MIGSTSLEISYQLGDIYYKSLLDKMMNGFKELNNEEKDYD